MGIGVVFEALAQGLGLTAAHHCGSYPGSVHALRNVSSALLNASACDAFNP